MSEDLIRRSDAIHILACEMYAEAQAEGYEVGSVEDYIPEAKAWMSDAPSADAVQGKWIPFDLTFGRSIWVCSACDNGTYVPCDAFTQKPIYDYCPNCGARMLGEDGEA